MRVAKLQIRTAMLAALALTASSCQTAQKPAFLLPPATAPALTAVAPSPVALPQQTPPAIKPATTPAQPQVQAQPPAETKPEPSATAPVPDPVGDLIAKVEKDYQAGLDAYQAGQTDAAKQAFDKAFNSLLESNLDIR